MAIKEFASLFIGLGATIWFAVFPPRSLLMKLTLGLIAIAFLIYGASALCLEAGMKISFGGYIILGALIGAIAAGVAYKYHQPEIKPPPSPLTAKQLEQQKLEAEKKKREIYLALYKFIGQANHIQYQCRGFFLDELRPGETLKLRFERWCTDIDGREEGFFVKNLSYEPYHTQFEDVSKYGSIIPPSDTRENGGIWSAIEGRKENLKEIAKKFETDPLITPSSL